TKARDAGVHFFIVDAPAAALELLAGAVRGRDILVFNASASDDSLRRNLCVAEFVHTLPSMAMGMDALMQFLVSRKWTNLLAFERSGTISAGRKARPRPAPLSPGVQRFGPRGRGRARPRASSSRRAPTRAGGKKTPGRSPAP